MNCGRHYNVDADANSAAMTTRASTTNTNYFGEDGGGGDTAVLSATSNTTAYALSKQKSSPTVISEFTYPEDASFTMMPEGDDEGDLIAGVGTKNDDDDGVAGPALSVAYVSEVSDTEDEDGDGDVDDALSGSFRGMMADAGLVVTENTSSSSYDKKPRVVNAGKHTEISASSFPEKPSLLGRRWDHYESNFSNAADGSRRNDDGTDVKEIRKSQGQKEEFRKQQQQQQQQQLELNHLLNGQHNTSDAATSFLPPPPPPEVDFGSSVDDNDEGSMGSIRNINHSSRAHSGVGRSMSAVARNGGSDGGSNIGDWSIGESIGSAGGGVRSLPREDGLSMLSEIESQVSRYGDLASRHLSLGQYEEAMTNFQRILAVTRDVIENFPDDDGGGGNEELKQMQHLTIADTLNNIGVMHEMAGEYKFGLQACREALSVYKKVGRALKTENDPEHRGNVKRTKNNIAQMNRAQESLPERTRLHSLANELCSVADGVLATEELRHRLGEALSIYRRALSLERSALGRSHPQVGRTLTKIGEVQRRLDQSDDAAQSLSMALFILRSALGESHPDVATAHLAMGHLHEWIMDMEGAIASYNEALKIQRLALGENHVDVASTWNNLGVLLFTKRRYDEALHAYMQSVSAYSRALDGASDDEDVPVMVDQHPRKRRNRKHPEIALLWNNIGEVYRAKKNHPKAMVAYQKALSMLRATVGNCHEYVVTTLLNMGVIHARNRDYDCAMSAYRDALAAQRNLAAAALPQKNDRNTSGRATQVDIAVTLKSIGVLFEKKGDLTRALNHYEESLRLRREALGHDHIDCARLLMSIGNVYDKRGRYGEGVAYHAEATRLYAEANVSVLHPREKLKASRTRMIHQTRGSRTNDDGATANGLASHLTSLGMERERMGDLLGAMSYLTGALNARRHQGAGKMVGSNRGSNETVEVAHLLRQMANLHEKRAELDEASALYGESLKIYRRNGLDYQHRDVRRVVREMNRVGAKMCPSAYC